MLKKLKVFLACILIFSALAGNSHATVKINNEATLTNNQTVTLDITYPSNTTSAAIQNEDNAFEQVNVSSPISWLLSDGDGLKSVTVGYVQTFRWNQSCYQYQSCCSLWSCWDCGYSYDCSYDYTQTSSETVQITLDTAQPSVTSTNPSSGENGVLINIKDVSVIFSENMDSSTINTNSFTADNGLTGKVAYDNVNKMAMYAPLAPLAYSTTYTFVLTSDVKDLAGNIILPEGYTWSFTTEPKPEPTILIKTNAIEFGEAMVGTVQKQDVNISNTGTANLDIGQITVSSTPFHLGTDGCSKQQIKPNGSCTVTFTFEPDGVYSAGAQASIPNNDPNNPTATISLSGTGTPIPAPIISVTESIAPIDDLNMPFGNITVDEQAVQTITVANNGNADLAMASIVTTSLTAPFLISNDGCSGNNIAPASNCTISIQFLPTAVGVFTGSISIESNDKATPSVNVALSGNGLPIPAPRIEVTPQTHKIEFGEVTVQTEKQSSVTITNAGTANLNIGQISSPASPFCIADDGCSNQVLAPTATCSFTVKYSPEFNVISNDKLDILSDDSGSPKVTVSISGTGLAMNGNNPPTASKLVFPADQQQDVDTEVTFRWEQSSDPDGDAVSYQLLVCEDSEFAGCSPVTIAAVKKEIYQAGMGSGILLQLFIASIIFGLIGPRRMKRLFTVLIVALVCSMSVSACNNHHDNPAPQTVLESTHTASLTPGITYYWKVNAIDSKGSITQSAVSSFTTKAATPE